MTAGTRLLEQLRTSIGTIVFGQLDVIDALACALLAQGHVLLEGPPGVGKTLTARSLAHLLGGVFQRVQCTPELMPSDLCGVNLWRQDQNRFEWLPGPLFANIVLVDELNRTGPKTQSALLEAMEERAVTVDRQRHALPPGFMVVATQNPHEFEGTFPLPESQLDRFLMRLTTRYPDAAVEAQILRAYDRGDAGKHQKLQQMPALPSDLLDAARIEMSNVYVSDALYQYVTHLAAATRKHAGIAVGLSPRGALALMRSARALACLRGESYLTPDHIKQLAPAVIAHRLITTPEAALDGETGLSLTQQILSSVAVPRDNAPVANNP